MEKWDIAKTIAGIGAGATGLGALLTAVRRFRLGPRRQREREALRTVALEVVREVAQELVVEAMNGERTAMLNRLDSIERWQAEYTSSTILQFDRIYKGIEALRKLVLRQAASNQPAQQQDPIT